MFVNKKKKNNVRVVAAGGSVVGLAAVTAAIVHGVRSRKVLKQIATDPIELADISPFSSYTIRELIKEASRLLEKTQRWKDLSIIVVKIGSKRESGVTEALDMFKAKHSDNVKLTVVQIQNDDCNDDTIDDDHIDTMYCFKDILDFPHDLKYDLVISTIPEQNIDHYILRKIQAKLRSLVSNHGTLVRVRYVIQWSYVWWLLSRQRKIELKQTVEEYRKFEDSEKSHRKFALKKVLVRRNIPPVNVIIMRF